MTNVIELHSASAQQADLWRLAEDVAATLDGLPWILNGGLMVQLLEAERGVASSFATGDVDLLAPDHIGTRTNILTVPPASTLVALGSRQALNRLRIVRVDTGDGAFDLPIPTLAGAIVIKLGSSRTQPGGQAY